MNQDVLKTRSERLALWVAAGGSGGLVSVGNASWLLVVSSSRVKHLVSSRRLTFDSPAGQRMIHFSSVLRYAKEGELFRLRMQQLCKAT